MNGLSFTYFFLNLICSLVFLFYGKILSQAKDDVSYYKRAMLPIMTYAFVHGMRWRRMIDWILYFGTYRRLGVDVTHYDYEPLFANVCHYLSAFGLPYVGFITLQCAFLMFCILVFMKNYKEYLPFILPIILAPISTNDLLIRWYIGFSFLLLSFNAMINGKKILMWFFYLCSVGSHIGYILFFPVLLFEKLLNRWILPPVVNAIMLVLCYGVFSMNSASSIIVNVAGFLLDMGLGNIDARVNLYLTMVQALVNGDGYVLLEFGPSTLFRLAVTYFPAVFFAYKYVDKIKHGRFFYNLFCFGAITTPIFVAEIVDRYSKATVFFSCLACAIVFKEFYDRRKELAPYFFWFLVVCYSFAVWPTVSQPIHYGEDPRCGNNQMFVWEAK